ncbi:hypothetical protein K227x_14130 [Rubripirellula lacrimiformis]|uniref:Methyltransferase domain-containing protein n=1 Tax=Rubripirellula lacrimiformis TaxID=1930273 RepID=A0A517N7C0_9BACT|nr:class I SAM-dependent methyltransferase [Rubripirellula lacrimiformis]QDT03034.1 hypothetical protein K227x_14130 [Rubripirellula lacrimiformis]
MSTAQERTLAQYHGLMRVNASAHLLRVAREVGLIAALRSGQQTAEQLADSLQWAHHSAALLIDGLISIGIIEQYGEDYALSRAGHLLCQYDDDLGDAAWQKLASVVRGDDQRSEHDDAERFAYVAATQWSHTSSAMQAAEILDIGEGGQYSGLKILDLGCGSAVWSCAIAHRDPESSVTAADTPAALEAAQSTADSIELTDRFTTIPGDPLTVELPADEFDLVLVAQRISCLDGKAGQKLLAKATRAAKPGGRVVVIDVFRGPTKPNLTECIEALRLDLGTRGGRLRSLEEAQADMQDAELQRIQFTFLAASDINMGMAVGTKLELSD